MVYLSTYGYKKIDKNAVYIQILHNIYYNNITNILTKRDIHYINQDLHFRVLTSPFTSCMIMRELLHSSISPSVKGDTVDISWDDRRIE